MIASNRSIRTNVRQLLMAAFEALEVVNVGLLLVNESGQPLLGNRTAEQILQVHDGLELDRSGALCMGKNRTPLLRLHPIPELRNSPQARDLVFAVERPSGKRPFTILIRSIRNK